MWGGAEERVEYHLGGKTPPLSTSLRGGLEGGGGCASLHFQPMTKTAAAPRSSFNP